MFRWIVAVLFILLTSPVMAEEAGENTAVNADNMAAVEKNSDAAKSVDNGLDINTDIQPLKAEMSENEKSQTSDIFAADDNEMTELKCDDARLKKQIVDFVFHTISKNPTNSVLENRSRVLLVRNMHDFQEIDPDKISSRDSYITATSLAYLKIKKQRKVLRVCVSRGNKTKGFNNVYAIIYPFSGYYRVAVTNLAPTSQDIDEAATFVFNW